MNMAFTALEPATRKGLKFGGRRSAGRILGIQPSLGGEVYRKRQQYN